VAAPQHREVLEGSVLPEKRGKVNEEFEMVDGNHRSGFKIPSCGSGCVVCMGKFK
jgi:hypothetical protein